MPRQVMEFAVDERHQLPKGLFVAAPRLGSAAGRKLAREPPPFFDLPALLILTSSKKTLSKTEQAARQILRKAAIDTECVGCPKEREEEGRYPACRAPGNAGDVVLSIVPESMEGWDVPPEALGLTLPSGDARPARHANVFYRRVGEAARRNGRVLLFTLLRHVMVHEIGHLLLGPATHLPHGIMRPRWQPRDMQEMEIGSLVFPSLQARDLSARVQERTMIEPSVY